MPLIVELDRIKEAVEGIDVIQDIEDGFVAYSQGKVQVPPVGEMHFEDPPGNVHIKYGAINDDDYYVIKLASGFNDNPTVGLPRVQGMMLIFNQRTGQPVAFLLDQGYLTNVRTAAMGPVVARALAPKNVSRIGVFGTGLQARMQVEYLKGVVDCTDVIAWGRSAESKAAYKNEMEAQGYTVEITDDAGAVAATSNLIIMSTPSLSPLLTADQVRPGTHITAMGSDTPDKIELDPGVLAKADVVVADRHSAVQAARRNCTGDEGGRHYRGQGGRARKRDSGSVPGPHFRRSDLDRRFDGRRSTGHPDFQSRLSRRKVAEQVG